MHDYPNNAALTSVINAIDANKADKADIPRIDTTLSAAGAAADAKAVGQAIENIELTPGPKGETGQSGVYLGEDEPMDENVNVWIRDTDNSDNVLSFVSYTPQELTEEQQAQARENIGIVDGGVLETVLDFVTTETVNAIHIPIDTDELVEKLRNMTEFRLTIHIPRDTTDTETATNGDVVFGVYHGWKNPLFELKEIIPAPTVTYTNYSQTYVLTFCERARSHYAPIFITRYKHNQTVSALTSSVNSFSGSIQSIRKGHYFYITGTQPMAKGTTVTMEVRV